MVRDKSIPILLKSCLQPDFHLGEENQTGTTSDTFSSRYHKGFGKWAIIHFFLARLLFKGGLYAMSSTYKTNRNGLTPVHWKTKVVICCKIASSLTFTKHLACNKGRHSPKKTTLGLPFSSTSSAARLKCMCGLSATWVRRKSGFDSSVAYNPTATFIHNYGWPHADTRQMWVEE